MKLHVGLLKPDYGFETIFQQYGIPYTLIGDNNSGNLTGFPIIIVNSVEDKYSKEKILKYVASGGYVLTTTKCYQDLFRCNGRQWTTQLSQGDVWNLLYLSVLYGQP